MARGRSATRKTRRRRPAQSPAPSAAESSDSDDGAAAATALAQETPAATSTTTTRYSTRSSTTTTTKRSVHREFGDMMSREGDTSHVSTIILLMYGALAAYSVLVSKLVGGAWYTQLAFYFAGLVAFYGWHAMAHTRFFGPMYKIHMRHHLHNFPPSNFYGKPGMVAKVYGKDCPTLWELMDPRKSTYFTLAHEGPLYLFMGIIIVIARFGFSVSWSHVVAATLLYGTMGTVGSALHSSFHVRGFHLEKYQWYLDLRALHYIHHLGNMRHNFAVLNLGLDAFFRSLALLDPVKKKAAPAHIADNVDDSDLPEVLDRPRLQRVRSSAGIASYLLGFDHAHHDDDGNKQTTTAVSRGYPTVLLRIVLVAAGMWLWFKTAAATGWDAAYNGEWTANAALVNDVTLDYAAKTRSWLGDGVDWSLAAGFSCLISEVAVATIIIVSCAGRSCRPFLALAAALILRLIITSVGAVPTPLGAEWSPPDWPSFFVIAETANRFICPRVVVATVAVIEVTQAAFAHFPRQAASAVLTALVVVAAIGILEYQVFVSLALRTHYGFDVLLALVVGRLGSIYASKLAPHVDSFMP